MPNYLERVDLPFYRQYIEGFLPDELVDFHTHVGKIEHMKYAGGPPRTWVDYLTPHSWTVESHYRHYATIFPGKKVTPVMFGMLSGEPDVDALNAYAAAGAAQHQAYAFLVTRPEWSGAELERRIREGGFRGLKPYPTMVRGKAGDDITVFDFLPREHMAVAQALGLPVILHLPRPGRLADPANLAELHHICAGYPQLKLVVAHIGRAYCLPNAEKGLPQLRDCANLYYDFSAATDADVFELALREVGPRRLIFGSDIPYVAFRARRYCEGDNYVNVVRFASFTDSHLRVASPEEKDSITFYVYEQIAAMRRAAERVGLSRADVDDIFTNNALRLLHG
jgi:predicted TIM-barrel fold metal-dependent hydrolase